MMNQVVLMGRLTADPELRTAGGASVTEFTVAVDRDRAAEAEKQTDFIDCVAWRSTAEFVAKHFTKGSCIALSGRLQIRCWEDRSGNRRRNAEIICEHVYFAGPKADRPPVFEEIRDTEELPF